MGDFRQVISSPAVCEGKSAVLTLQLTKEDDAALTKAEVAALTLRLYEQLTRADLNSRTGVSILDAAGGALSATALLTLDLSPADNALAFAGSDEETHVALIEWTWASGAKKGAKEITFPVVNQRKL